MKIILLVLTNLVAENVADPLAKLEKLRVREGRIYGGRNATIEEFPYQVSLEFNSTYICGGAIVTKKHVLTAGHCLQKAQHFKNLLEIRAGATIVREKGSLHNVEQLFIHEKYHENLRGYPSNDIVVLKLEQPINFDRTRQPVRMFEPKKNFKVGSMTTVTGWGKTETGYPKQLQAVDVPMINTEKCHAKYKTSVGPSFKGQICAGTGNKDACFGDSGGPLVHDHLLIGLVSYGPLVGCANPSYPGVYTEIAYFRDWIDDKIQISL